ncbi:NAD(P)/FAD-dependent oxidoreductase [Mongoliibacter ruber]|uniref:Flavin-dependent dehydrogenase n=1 Tax=Mongoliibacter ruber TaxID=1750599 RepID=A0A2T0WT87_9BACT|nr:NAD(P)/FAD-dependent oxidoreductase [Mongoliibacter ruber]PRY89912.1 flavin-dependent dehydrogenase [Mongoliibacter ruber]
MKNYEIIVIGGGLGGLTAAHQLAKAGREVLVIEKKAYPFHRVCGEYISNEVQDFLKLEGLFPDHLNPTAITQFELGSIKGNLAKMPLDLGGFGISRYTLDEFIYTKCQKVGAEFMLQVQVEEVQYHKEADRFEVLLSDGKKLSCKFLIGAFGKRSKIDKHLERDFMQQRSPFIGVKYHIKTEFDADKVALYNFEGGYCGINQIEEGKFNLCYLGNSKQLKKYGSISSLEENILCKNPQLNSLFKNSDFLFEKPEVINEISFEPKPLIENHIMMIGDAAGLITPLCGNGMAMAIHSGKILSECILTFSERKEIESQYLSEWNRNFKSRLWVGRKVQWLFGSNAFSEMTVSLIKNSKFLANQIMKRTHGEKISP